MKKYDLQSAAPRELGGERAKSLLFKIHGARGKIDRKRRLSGTDLQPLGEGLSLGRSLCQGLGASQGQDRGWLVPLEVRTAGAPSGPDLGKGTISTSPSGLAKANPCGKSQGQGRPGLRAREQDVTCPCSGLPLEFE